MAVSGAIDPLDKNQLDLHSVVNAVARPNRWPDHKADVAELWYRRFLKLSQSESQKNKKIAAVFGIAYDADTLWHEHITQTIKYRADTTNIFGGFLDHTPETPPNFGPLLEASIKLYQETFGAVPPDATTCCI